MRRQLNRTISGLLMIALLCFMAMPALATEEGIADLSGELTGTTSAGETSEVPQNSANMQTADVIIGYVSAEGAPLNPVYCNEWDLISVNQLVFESVVDLDENMKPVPMLADSWTKDGKTWVFKLRSGIRFHNGYDLTSYDVVRSYETLLQAGSANPYYGRLQLIDSMEATDAQTLTVQARYSGLVTLYGMNFPVMQYSTLADDMPRGTGPYWYIQHDMDGTVRLEANPLWWKQQPGVQSVLLRRYAETGDALEAIQTNQIQMLSSNSSKAALSRKLADLTSMDYTTLTYEMLIPNLHESSIMSDVRIRQAVMYAIDRSTIASNAYVDMAIQSEVPIPPVSWLYESQSAVYYYSPERALQLMYEAGWYDLTGNGNLNRLDGIMLEEPSITLITYNEPTTSIRQNAAELIAQYLEAVGFDVTISVLSRSSMENRIKNRDYDLALVGVNLSEVPNLYELLSSKGSLNMNRYSSDEMDSLLSQAGSAATEAELLQIYSQIQMIVVDRLPIMGLLFRTGTVLSSRSIGGMYGLRAYDNFNGFEFLTMD